MCRAIKTLHNFSPPAREDEIRASSLQFVRKLSGFTKPSKANEAAFNRAVEGENAIGEAICDSPDRRGLTDCPQICADLRKLQKTTLLSENLCESPQSADSKKENSFSSR